MDTRDSDLGDDSMVSEKKEKKLEGFSKPTKKLVRKSTFKNW